MNDLLKLHKTVGGNKLNKLTYREYLDEHFNLGELKGVLVENNKLNFYPISTFLELNGEDFEDKSLNNHSITKTGNVSIVDTDIGKSYYFNATLGGIDLPQNTITINKTYSIETLVRFKGNPTDYHVIFHQGSSSYDIRLSIPTARTTIDFHYWNGSTTNQGCGSITLPKALDLNVWYKLTFIFVAETLMFKVYLDDVFIGDKKCTSLPTLKSGVQRIGANASSGGYSNLEMKYINFYDYDLIAYEPPTLGYRISPPIELPRNIVSTKIDWEGEGKISLYDPNYKAQVDSHTLLLLTGDDFNDKSSYNNEVTNKNVTIVDDPKYGACYSTTTNKSLSVLNKDDMFSFGDKDFTLDFRIKFNSFFANLGIFTPMGDTAWVSKTGSWHIIGHANKTITFDYYSNTSTVVQLSSKALVENTWYHIALVVKNKVVSLYIDGVKQGSLTLAVPLIGQSKILIAKHDGNNEINLQGYLTDFRISDVARWETDFNTDFRYAELIGSYLELNKGETFKIPQKYLSSIHLKQEVKGEETISNVKLELKHKPKKEYIRPNDLLNNEEDVNKPFLYKSGEEYTSLTGGWVSTSENTASIGKSFTKGTSEMIIWSHNNNALGAGYWVHTSNTIDLTPYSKVKALLVKNGTGYRNRMFVGEDMNVNYFDYVNAPNGEFIAEIDISSINSSNRIRFTHFTASGQNSEIKIKQVWLEK